MFEDEDDTLTLNFADLDLKTVWAGHLFKITIGTKDVALIDQKTGQMDLTIRDVRKEGTITKELEALVVSKSVTLPNKLKTNKWHQVYATIKSDELTCTIDGKFVGRFRSEGFAHETKKLLRLLVAKNAYVDDVKIWRRK